MVPSKFYPFADELIRLYRTSELAAGEGYTVAGFLTTHVGGQAEGQGETSKREHSIHGCRQMVS